MLVAFIGVILRYKIAYSLPFVDQKNLLHGHSHFAFAGWISQALMALMISCLSGTGTINYFKKYRWILFANLGAAYGMLFSFPVQGYGLVSIIFSTASIFVSYVFAIVFWRDMSRNSNPAHAWFKVALIGNAISSIGPYVLAYMMATKHMNQRVYLGSVYFFLHFQYNVWFFFSCMGLLIQRLNTFQLAAPALKKVFVLFSLASGPAFFLSVLWWPIPAWLYTLVIAAVICQLAGWIMLIRFVRAHVPTIRTRIPQDSQILFLLSAIALSIKLLLQAGSVVPAMSRLAFGFRPIVVGYLHLVLLGVITIFILSYTVSARLITINKFSRTGLWIFTGGIFFNELLLMTQGVADLCNAGLPFINQLLLFAALTLFAGMSGLVYGQYFSKADLDHNSSSNKFSILKKNI
jgi:hypothetical protein